MGGKAKGPEPFVALLRGINVGGHNKLPMAALRELFEEAGAEQTRSYIQSGNIVFHAPVSQADTICVRVKQAITARFGLRVPIILRSAAEFRRLALHNPYLSPGPDLRFVHLLCLASTPNQSQMAALDPERSPPDRFTLVGKDLYLYFPQGSARSKLTTDYFDRCLSTTSTGRNWKTVLKLVDMLAA